MILNYFYLFYFIGIFNQNCSENIFSSLFSFNDNDATKVLVEGTECSAKFVNTSIFQSRLNNEDECSVREKEEEHEFKILRKIYIVQHIKLL